MRGLRMSEPIKPEQLMVKYNEYKDNYHKSVIGYDEHHMFLHSFLYTIAKEYNFTLNELESFQDIHESNRTLPTIMLSMKNPWELYIEQRFALDLKELANIINFKRGHIDEK
jgi:hypothetical protein